MGDVPRETAPTPHFEKPKVKENQATQTHPLHFTLLLENGCAMRVENVK